MDRPEIDHRTKEDILEYIEKCAVQYTPEWRFDRENPDAGTVLARVYADMFAKTLGKMNRVLEKNRIAFFNSINAGLLPPVPASGYAVFNMVNDSVDGAKIPRGMGVYADTDDGEVPFKTVDDLYATPAQITDIYHVWDDEDVIRHIYHSDGAEDNMTGVGGKEMTLFEVAGENLQRHELYFSNDTLFNIRHEATIQLIFYARGDVKISEEYTKLLMNREMAVFEYSTADGFEEIRPALDNMGVLVFHKNEAAPPFAKAEVDGVEGYFIRCRILNMAPFDQFSFESLYMTVKGVYIEPDVIISNGIDCNPVEYTPFGERFGLYNEVYFASSEALSKKGSLIDFAFTMDFARVPLNDVDDEDGISWNWVMKKSDFKVDVEYDLTIEEVIWEYYNGNGWSRLFADNSYSDIFSTVRGLKSQYRTMRFLCPQDMASVLVNSCESCYIRARVIKINNMYKNKGYYVAPVLSDTVFSYDYARNTQVPQCICTVNNLEIKRHRGIDNGSIRPFYHMGVKENALYVGFSRALDDGPVKILFTMAENMSGLKPQFRWEYYTDSGFKETSLLDETDGFSKTGIVTLMGNPEFARGGFFGKNLYWIRIVDETGHFSSRTSELVYPCVQAVHMNAVKITNVDLTKTQYFSTERYEENRKLRLMYPHVIDIDVWVDEAQHLSERQLAELQREREVDCIYAPSGLLANAWVKWDETEDFLESGSGSRCYCVDKNEGIITFGNGRFGKIVPASRSENVKVIYQCGGGDRTNLPAGAVKRMEYAVGFVRSVTNPHRILGGCDQESLASAIQRSAMCIRNRSRAVTPKDYEQLAMCASRNISRVQCFTGYDASGKASVGAVTLVILQKDFQSGRYVFNDIKEQIYAYMKDKIDGYLLADGRFFLTEPEFVEVCIRLELTALDFNQVFSIKKEAEMRLERFLNPLSGHFDGRGWEIGVLPTNIQIQNLLRDIRGVKYIKNIYLSVYISGRSGRTEVDTQVIRRHPFVLPVNGRHSISIRVE